MTSNPCNVFAACSNSLGTLRGLIQTTDFWANCSHSISLTTLGWYLLQPATSLWRPPAQLASDGGSCAHSPGSSLSTGTRSITTAGRGTVALQPHRSTASLLLSHSHLHLCLCVTSFLSFAPARPGLCWYQSQFGNRAHKCNQPCAWSGTFCD